jgi:hypothetical protein
MRKNATIFGKKLAFDRVSLQILCEVGVKRPSLCYAASGVAVNWVKPGLGRP